MNPMDLLTAQQRIAHTMNQAMPDAPQVAQRPSRHPVRHAAARASAGLGTLLIRLGERLQAPDEVPQRHVSVADPV